MLNSPSVPLWFCSSCNFLTHHSPWSCTNKPISLLFPNTLCSSCTGRRPSCYPQSEPQVWGLWLASDLEWPLQLLFSSPGKEYANADINSNTPSNMATQFLMPFIQVHPVTNLMSKKRQSVQYGTILQVGGNSGGWRHSQEKGLPDKLSPFYNSHYSWFTPCLAVPSLSTT